MTAKPHSRNWNDVQTAIATVAIVTTLGMWNLFATPTKAKIVRASEPILPPTEPPFEMEAPSIPTAMPQVKIMFTPGVTPTAIVQAQAGQQIPTKKKRHKNNNGGGTVTVTQTKTS
jgi:hypothetical protein